MAGIGGDYTMNIFLEREEETKHPAFEGEMGLYTLVALGKVDQIDEYRKGKPQPDAKERGVLSENPLRNAMYHFVAMTTMITRVCISYGMRQEEAYKMSDTFIQKADKLSKPEEVREFQSEMITGFARAMSLRQKRDIHSKQVVKCMDYIGQHLHEKISMNELAEHVKLNETDLSKLFRKETGMSISEYIREKKIEEAKGLLRFTEKSSIEIATDLGFSSHSYFISVFKKVTGITPKEYRNRYFRKM